MGQSSDRAPAGVALVATFSQGLTGWTVCMSLSPGPLIYPTSSQDLLAVWRDRLYLGESQHSNPFNDWVQKSKIPFLSQSMVDVIVRPVHVQGREEDSRPHDQSRDSWSSCLAADAAFSQHSFHSGCLLHGYPLWSSANISGAPHVHTVLGSLHVKH